MTQSPEAAVEALTQARRNHSQLTEFEVPADLAAAYAIQEAGISAILDVTGGGHPIGWKCGATNDGAMKNFGLSEPFRARLLSPFALDHPAVISWAGCMTPALECEVAFRMGRDLDPADAPFDEATVLAAVDAVMPAIEVIDFRVQGAPAKGGLVVIADAGGAGFWVPGAAMTDWSSLDFTAIAVELKVNGATAQTGSSGAVLGNPLTSLTWLANDLAKKGVALRAGEVVTTGTCTPVQPVKQGDEVAASFAGLGEVTIRFA
ncbi:MAG: fumarylacetoacetate hydrolase family protein [Alphaproteobacteria bacterium]